MKIRLIKRKSIENFVLANARSRSRSSFSIWLAILKRANWNNAGDISKTFGSADLPGKRTNRVVFDIAGNNYRMICKYHFGETFVHLYIKWTGIHAEYTTLSNQHLQYIINNF